jgi:predicted metal-dependent peptidase
VLDEVAMSDYVLEHDVFRLLREEPFFAAISRSVNKVPSNSIPTAGVRITKDGFFEMLYNPSFFEGMSDSHRRGVLKHEFYHLIFEHCLLRNPESDGKVSKIWNWATDLSINCHLKGELPEMALMPSKFDFPDYLTAEQYLDLLQKKQNSADGEGGGMEGEGQFDDHEGWGGEAGEEAQAAAAIARERLREAARQGAEEAAKSSRGFGNMTSLVSHSVPPVPTLSSGSIAGFPIFIRAARQTILPILPLLSIRVDRLTTRCLHSFSVS